MAKIYYDPDTDELIPVSRPKQGTVSSPSQVSSAGTSSSASDADDLSHRLERIEAELKALNRKTDAAGRQHADDMRHSSSGCDSGRVSGESEDAFSEGFSSGYGDGYAAGAAASAASNASDQAAFLFGAYAGWKFVDEVSDSVKDAFSLKSSCGCGKKKKWF